MARIIFPEFRDEQSDSRYPFADTATLLSDTGFFIPKSCLVDANFHVIGGVSSIYLAGIFIEADRVRLTFSDSAANNRCSGEYGPEELSEKQYATIELTDRLGRPAGVVVGRSAELQLLSGWPAGAHNFAPAATEIVATAVTPAQEPGVRGLVGPAGELLAGDLWLVGDNGVVLRILDENTIQVNIIGDPLFKRAECINSEGAPIGDFSPRNYLKTINGCPPDKYGNFNFVVKSHNDPDTIKKQILRIYPDETGLKIAAVGSRVL